MSKYVHNVEGRKGCTEKLVNFLILCLFKHNESSTFGNVLDNIN